MTLVLERGTEPKGLRVKAGGLPEEMVYLGDYQISLQDFLIMAHYVLTNSNLRQGDPRLQFLECVRSMQEVEGYLSIGFGGVDDPKRLMSTVPPVVDQD